MINNYKKRGHLCAKAWIPRYYGSIHCDGRIVFCEKHNFVYDVEKETDKLYMGLPCIFTDKRFYSDVER